MDTSINVIKLNYTAKKDTGFAVHVLANEPNKGKQEYEIKTYSNICYNRSKSVNVIHTISNPIHTVLRSFIRNTLFKVICHYSMSIHRTF